MPFNTNKARFEIGQHNFQSGVHRGGGIFQDFFFSGGLIDFSVDVASWSNHYNGSGGRYQLLIDNIVRDTFDTRDIGSGIEKDILTASLKLATGTHELRILITRPYILPGNLFHYVDNIVATSESIPEPATIALISLGLAGIGFAQKKVHS